MYLRFIGERFLTGAVERVCILFWEKLPGELWFVSNIDTDIVNLSNGNEGIEMFSGKGFWKLFYEVVL